MKWITKLFRKPVAWGNRRCPHCNALMFEANENVLVRNSIRIKCRKCKNIVKF